jgi:cell division protein FtsA
VFWEIRRSGYEKKLIAGLVLTGGGSLLKHINLLAEYHTGLTCRKGQPIEHLAHGYSSALASPIYSTAIGLLIHAINNEELKKELRKEMQTPSDEPLIIDEMDVEQKNKWIKKLFTYTKEFFEAAPDTDF